jgi:hypothetical protein
MPYRGFVPSSRLEWLVFFLGGVLVAGIIYLAIRTGHESASAPQAAVTRSVTTTRHVETTVGPTTTAKRALAPPRDVTSLPRPPASALKNEAKQTGQKKQPPRQAPERPTLRLRITATRGPSWLVIRALTSSGQVLYLGILNQGQTAEVAGPRLWASFGAASNLDAALNGAPLELGSGTFDARIDRSGLQKVPLGTVATP